MAQVTLSNGMALDTSIMYRAILYLTGAQGGYRVVGHASEVTTEDILRIEQTNDTDGFTRGPSAREDADALGNAGVVGC